MCGLVYSLITGQKPPHGVQVYCDLGDRTIGVLLVAAFLLWFFCTDD
jgi:hypothetical protein